MVALEDPEVHENRAFTIVPLITRALRSKADPLKNTHITSRQETIEVINKTLKFSN